MAFESRRRANPSLQPTALRECCIGGRFAFRAGRLGRVVDLRRQPGSVLRAARFSPRELNRIREIIYDNLDTIIEAWYEHCG